jgi:hypothetical protein
MRAGPTSVPVRHCNDPDDGECRGAARVRGGVVPAAAVRPGRPRGVVRRSARQYHGRGIIEKKHSNDVEPPPPPPCVCISFAFTLQVNRVPISVECLFSMTLLRGVQQ